LTIAFSFSDPAQTAVQGKFTGQGTALYTPDAPGSADPFAGGAVELAGQGTLTANFVGTTGPHAITHATNPALESNLPNEHAGCGRVRRRRARLQG
jgi:hypothetical protein